MTYEQFEYEVINRLLASTRPKLKRFRKQIRHLKVLTRHETETGFVTTFSAPSILAFDDTSSTADGMTIELPTGDKVDIDLTIKNGLIESLNGVFIGDLRYADLLRHFNQLIFTQNNPDSTADPATAAPTETEPDQDDNPAFALDAAEEHQSDDDLEEPDQKHLVAADPVSATVDLESVEQEELSPEADEASELEEADQVEGARDLFFQAPTEKSDEQPDEVKDEELPKKDESPYTLIVDNEEALKDDFPEFPEEKKGKIPAQLIIMCVIIGIMIGALFALVFLGGN